MSSFGFENSSSSSSLFNKSTDLTSDSVDQTQKSIQNSKFANYSLPNYIYTQNIISSNYIDFESQHLTMTTGNPVGPGIAPDVIDTYSDLTVKGVIKERHLGKLDLQPRPYITVPFLGRGSCDVDAETKLIQGEYFFDKKSVNTIMEQSFTMDYSLLKYNEDNNDRQNVVEEFPREGVSSRYG